MHNSYIHGGVSNPAAWVNDYVVTQTDLQRIDDGIFSAINGDLGGSWAPATPIVIGGAGLDLQAGLTCETTAGALFKGTVDFRGLTVFDASAGGSIEIFQQVDLYGGSGGKININSGALLFVANGASFVADLSSGFTVYSSLVNFGDGVDASAVNFNLGCAVKFSDAVTFQSGPVNFAKPGVSTPVTFTPYAIVSVATPFICSGSGTIVPRTVTPSGVATSYGVNDGDIFIRTTALPSNVIFTITAAGALQGSRMRFVKTIYDGFYMNLQREDLSSLGSIDSDGTHAGYFRKWIDLVFNSGRWEVCGGQLQ